jgi:hypothetical protein
VRRWGDVPSQSPVVHGVHADTLRGAGRHAEAIETLHAAIHSDDDDQDQAATVLAFIRELAENGDDQPHSVAEAFAKDD